MASRLVWDVLPHGDLLGRVDELLIDGCTVHIVRDHFRGYALTIERPDGTRLLARIEKHGQRAAICPTYSDIRFDEENR
jgi:hypothetical protein